MSHYAMDKLKKDLDKLIEECAENGVGDGGKCLDVAKTALSAKAKILTIEAMERVSQEGYGRGRRANGQYMDGDYRDDGGNYHDSGRYYRDDGEYRDSRGNYHDGGMEHLQKMLSRAEPREREIIEKMLRKM